MTEDPRPLEDVERLVGELPDAALAELAEGPLPGKLCRVCGVLRHLDHPAAKALHDWHEFFEDTPALDGLTKAWRDHPGEAERHEHRRALGEWRRVAGMLSHARCCMVYLAAELELGRRTAS